MIGAALDGVSDIPFLLQPPQDRANGGLLERPREFFACLLGSEGASSPNELHYLMLEFAKIGKIVFQAALRNATDRSI
jgi:hypothetical protein